MAVDEHRTLIPTAHVEDIVAGPAGQLDALDSAQRVGGLTGEARIGQRLVGVHGLDEQVGSQSAIDFVAAFVGLNIVIAGRSIQHVRPGTTEDKVVPRPGAHRVVATAGEDLVDPTESEDTVVAFVAKQQIVADVAV